jgi:ribonuclease R
VERVEKRQRLDSHRLIEEFMIAANVCAAETLETARRPCMYRIHDEPPADKLLALRQYLQSLGVRLAGGQAVRPRHFAQTLAHVADTPHAHAVNEAILRAQSQAVYSPENPGHFGLALRRYCHFTSPIRRYADLIVHRALITALNLGADGLGTDTENGFAALGEHLSMTERRATAAERETLDRLMASYLSDRIGAEFDGRINGVERFGLFVTLEETGGDGLLPASALGDDSYRLDAARRMLIGRHRGEEFRLGDTIRVRLAEADRLTGGLVFVRPDGPPPGRRPGPPRRIKGAREQRRRRRRPTRG